MDADQQQLYREVLGTLEAAGYQIVGWGSEGDGPDALPTMFTIVSIKVAGVEPAGDGVEVVGEVGTAITLVAPPELQTLD